jgi:hypothetical protein
MGCIICKSLYSTIIQKTKHPIIQLSKKSDEITLDTKIELSEKSDEITLDPEIQLSKKSDEITLDPENLELELDSYSSCDFEIVTKYDL